MGCGGSAKWLPSLTVRLLVAKRINGKEFSYTNLHPEENQSILIEMLDFSPFLTGIKEFFAVHATATEKPPLQSVSTTTWKTRSFSGEGCGSTESGTSASTNPRSMRSNSTGGHVDGCRGHTLTHRPVTCIISSEGLLWKTCFHL